MEFMCWQPHKDASGKLVFVDESGRSFSFEQMTTIRTKIIEESIKNNPLPPGWEIRLNENVSFVLVVSVSVSVSLFFLCAICS